MVHDCMQRFDVDGKFRSLSIVLDSGLKRSRTNEANISMLVNDCKDSTSMVSL